MNWKSAPTLTLSCTVLVLLTVLGVVTLEAAQDQSDSTESTATKATQWQFASIKVPVDTPTSELGKQVLKMGRDGWEMITVTNLTKDGTTTHSAFYFKRPL